MNSRNESGRDCDLNAQQALWERDRVSRRHVDHERRQARGTLLPSDADSRDSTVIRLIVYEPTSPAERIVRISSTPTTAWKPIGQSAAQMIRLPWFHHPTVPLLPSGLFVAETSTPPINKTSRQQLCFRRCHTRARQGTHLYHLVASARRGRLAALS